MLPVGPGAHKGPHPETAEEAPVSNAAFLYAVVAGVSLATYVIAARLGATGTHPVLGTTIVTGIAFLINAFLIFCLRTAGSPLPFAPKSTVSLVVVGVATASVNLFTLLAYAHGLRVTSSFVIGGTSTLVVLLVGFLLLREPFSWTKLLAIALIAAGTVLLQRADA